MLKNYFKIAWRNLTRHKRISMINVFGLSIGMAATILIVLWVQNELSYDSYHRYANNIYLIRSVLGEGDKTSRSERTQYIFGEHAAKDVPEAEAITRIRPMPVDLHNGSNITTEPKAAYIDGSWFNIFDYDVTDGSIESFKSNPFSLILTESAAIKYFGKQEAVGKTMRIDSNVYQVQAIIKDNPANSSFQYDVLIPTAAELTNARTKTRYLQWGNSNYITFIKLKPGAVARRVETELADIFRRNVKIDAKYASVYSLLPVKDLHFQHDVMFSGFQHGSKTMVDIFIVLAALLLLTACINYVNLTTARAIMRSKEVGIRKIVGAGRLNLFGQFMSESFVISLLAVIISIVIVQTSIPWYRSFTDKHFADPISSPLVWTIVGGTLLVSFLLNGLYPAAMLSSFKPLNVFRGRAVLNLRDSGLRKSLVILQFTISVILIIGTLVIYRQLQYVENADLGYNRAQVFIVDLPYKAFRHVDSKDMPAKLNIIKQEFKMQSAIADAAVANGTLADFGSSSGAGSFDWSGKQKNLDFSVMRLETDPDFQRVMHLKVTQGRWFTAGKSDEHNAVLNETALKMFGLNNKSAIGMRFVHTGDTGVIIGVVKDFHYASLHDKIGPVVISNDQTDGLEVYVKAFHNNIPRAIASAQKIVHNLAPDEPFVYNFLDDTYNSLYRTERQSSILIALFAGIAVLVSALGLLGLATFASQQKTKEIGIRKVLGASVANIVRLLSTGFVSMVLVACFVAFPVAWWAMHKWLENFAYRIDLSWWFFAGAAVIALLIAIITVGAQAIKAAITNPAESLRSE
jgi:putative ABC transport system permease protein